MGKNPTALWDTCRVRGHAPAAQVGGKRQVDSTLALAAPAGPAGPVVGASVQSGRWGKWGGQGLGLLQYFMDITSSTFVWLCTVVYFGGDVLNGFLLH